MKINDELAHFIGIALVCGFLFYLYYSENKKIKKLSNELMKNGIEIKAAISEIRDNGKNVGFTYNYYVDGLVYFNINSYDESYGIVGDSIQIIYLKEEPEKALPMDVVKDYINED